MLLRYNVLQLNNRGDNQVIDRGCRHKSLQMKASGGDKRRGRGGYAAARSPWPAYARIRIAGRLHADQFPSFAGLVVGAAVHNGRI